MTRPDGSIVQTSYTDPSTLKVTDEAGRQRLTITDALGHLIEVHEPNPSAPPTPASGTVSIIGTLLFQNNVGQYGANPGSGSVTISGSAQNFVDTSNCRIVNHIYVCHMIYDHGTVYLTVNGVQAGCGYGQTANTTSTAMASCLASSITNATNSTVTASASGSTINMTARTGGAASNYAFSVTSSYDTADFSSPSYTGSSGNLLAAGLNSGSAVSATSNGATITLIDKTPGSSGNGVTGTASSQSTQTQWTFSQSSFCPPPGCSGTLGGALDAGDVANNPYVTQYQYDGLGDLLRVDQKGSAPSDSTQWRTRLFTYDSLSRLLTASNPESGSICYGTLDADGKCQSNGYDGNGNLLYKTSPAPNLTGTATQTISFCYDALNRLTGKAYSAQTCTNGLLPAGTAIVSQIYDQGTNGIGHFTSVTDQAGSGSYGYDSVGHILSESRTIAGVTKSMRYGYDLDGSLKTFTYPSLATVTYTPDSAGRILKAVDNGNSINYITGATYAPHGALTGFVSGQSSSFGGIPNGFVYNNRLQACRTTASSTGAVPTSCTNSWGNLLDLEYLYNLGAGDNGNVTQLINYRDQTRNQTFTYDALNRLTSAQNAGTDCSVTLLGGKAKFWGNSYGYDAWGNLLSMSVTKCSSENLNVTALANNQLSGYGYDAAGNMTYDPTDGVAATYDAENRIGTATKNGVSTTYTYDADGNRVEKSNGTTGTLYWYMTPGIVAESDLAGNLTSEYVFFNGERVARKDFPSTAVSYYFSDHLKSTSLITDANGNIKMEYDYTPWGSERQFTDNDPNQYKFTGKPRDPETQLDYFGARYYSSGAGRFLRPDPSNQMAKSEYALKPLYRKSG